jgi:NADPH2 dehydrogenase
MYSADHDGQVNDWHLVHYSTRAIGGVGLIILEATAVEPRGRISSKDLGIWSDEQVAGLKQLVDLIHANGSQVILQLAHAGRKSKVEGEPILAPSAIAFSDEYKTPAAMTQEQIDEVIEAFQHGARRALEVGFDGIEIHAAHGYLINQFLSPLTNQRTDSYGGNLENRTKFLRQVLAAVGEVWDENKPISLRVSAEEYHSEGNHPNDIVKIINRVKKGGIDLIHVSSGGVVNATIPLYPGYQLTFAETIKTHTGLPVIAGGLITKSKMAEEIIRNGRADFVFVGRELLRNPYWPLHASQKLGIDIPWPEQYERSK